MYSLTPAEPKVENIRLYSREAWIAESDEAERNRGTFSDFIYSDEHISKFHEDIIGFHECIAIFVEWVDTSR